jgi:soluble lytic murein transglycosylase-like protein
MLLKALVSTLAVVFAATAAAQGDSQNLSAGVPNEPVSPNDCVTAAAGYHQVNPWVLRAIIKVESNFNAGAVNKNRNGTVDVGIAQINSMHFKELARYGVGPGDLMNACTSSYIAAWHLRKQINRYGNTWFAVGAYHSSTACYNQRYRALVWNTLLTWNAVQGRKEQVATMESCKGVSVASASPKKQDPSSILAVDND